MTRILGEYTTLAGGSRRVVAVERAGPPGWCLLDVSARTVASEDDVQIVRRHGAPRGFAAIAEWWIRQASTSPLSSNWFEWWIAREAQRNVLAVQATVDIYRDRLGMRRLVLAAEASTDDCVHLVDVPVDPNGAAARLVAIDVEDRDHGRALASVYVEQRLLQVAAQSARAR